MNAYNSYIRFGEEHVDSRFGLKGYPVATSIFEYGCERTTLEWKDENGVVNTYTLDAPRLSDNPLASVFKSEVVLGKTYTDQNTGIKGTADQIVFNEYGAPNVVLSYKDKYGVAQELYVDEGRLRGIGTATREKEATVKTGGPMRGSSHIRQNPTRR